MRIGELARRSGLSRDTLRFYERQGLIRSTPGPDATNSYRDYPEDALITLEQIADAQAAGISIADLTVLLGQLQAADPDTFDGEAFLQDRIDEVEARIARAERFLEGLKRAKAALAAPPVRR
ncbi:MerR family transcriptional regulator [Ruegeria sediminis]|uniref:MerR family transcriptional regulator n=1 Tax=Ruegeria sediminis TaxID=2583820 RepID=A0ABY2X308_9RHOB|nr:MerR family transcriptional regulator [Ruegeria sediminis]TMV09766.1 MerR family transcriptional regulator [Ruegeria sediminis]